MISKKLMKRIINTATDDLTKLLAATTEELCELGKECSKAIRQASYNQEKIFEEFVDCIVVLVMLMFSYGFTDSMIEQRIIKVCERYEQK